MKLSIVVPIFNVEAYIAKCADSLVKQTVPNDDFEVIFVNDGTKDNSITILRDVVDFENHQNFHLVEKENGGLSSARNYGMEYVKGEYVWFVDSDDWIDEDAVVKVLPLLSGEDAIHFPLYYRESSTGTIIKSVASSGITGSQITRGQYQYPVQFSIYRKDFLNENNLTFRKDILMEDLHFTPRALYKAVNLLVADFPVYHYLQRDGSIMKSKVTRKRIEDRIWIAHDLYKFMEDNVTSGDKVDWASCIITDLNATMFDACRSNDPELLLLAKNFINKETRLTALLKHSTNRRNRIWYWLSKVAFGNFYIVYKVLFSLRYKHLN